MDTILQKDRDDMEIIAESDNDDLFWVNKKNLWGFTN